MARKRWTAKTEVTDSLLISREKRKWQIALRRYVLERNKSSFYAPYFGLDVDHFRQWIELQFDEDIYWDNFSKAWQLDHIIPLAYFDFTNEAELKLCWNFINIQVKKTEEESRGKIDVLAAKAYFKELFQKTNYTICQKMVEKIESLEQVQNIANPKLEGFLLEKKNYLETLCTFSSYDFDKLNSGIPVKDIVYENEFLKKFG